MESPTLVGRAGSSSSAAAAAPCGAGIHHGSLNRRLAGAGWSARNGCEEFASKPAIATKREEPGGKNGTVSLHQRQRRRRSKEKSHEGRSPLPSYMYQRSFSLRRLLPRALADWWFAKTKGPTDFTLGLQLRHLLGSLFSFLSVWLFCRRFVTPTLIRPVS